MDEIGVAAGEIRALTALLKRVSATTGPLTMRTRADLDVHANLLASLLQPAPPRHTVGAFAAATEIEDWPGRDASRPAGPEGLQHAVTGSGTACGLPRRAIVVWQHRFSDARLDACPQCVRRAQEKGEG